MIITYLNKIIKLKRNLKILLQILCDIILITIALILAMALRIDSFYFITNSNFILYLALLIPITILFFYFGGIYLHVVRFINEKIYIDISKAVFFSSLLMITILQLFQLGIPRSVPLIFMLIFFFFSSGIRLFIRVYYLAIKFDKRKFIAIYGAGYVGRQILNSMSQNFEYIPILFIDDDKNLHKKNIAGLKVYNFEDATIIFKKYNISEVLIAISKISKLERKKIIEKLERLNLRVKIIPSMNDLIQNKEFLTQIRNISVEDYLEREKVHPIQNLLIKNIKNKNVLITGSGGSIGSELCEQIHKIGPKNLILLDHSEFSLYEITKKLSQNHKNISLIPILGSINNKNLLKKLFKKFDVDTIYHAAAYKHVPILESNISEAIQNNVFGTYNLANEAIKGKVKNFTLISTDKAVRPTSIMGASKRLAEIICQTLDKKNNTIFTIVRFGNVLGSSGSVIPLFKEQISKGGPVTVTHKKVMRYFMTISEAAELVIQAGAMSTRASVFVLDMGKPVSILNLAKKIITSYGLSYSIGKSNSKSDIKIEIIGLRPGEKLYEELLLSKSFTKTKHPRINKANEKVPTNLNLLSILNSLSKACSNNNYDMIKTILLSTKIYFKS